MATPTYTPYKVKDLSLADWGRKTTDMMLTGMGARNTRTMIARLQANQPYFTENYGGNDIKMTCNE